MLRKQAQWELRSSLNTSGTYSQVIFKNRQRFLLEVQPYNSSKHNADKMGSLLKQCVVLMGDAHNKPDNSMLPVKEPRPSVFLT